MFVIRLVFGLCMTTGSVHAELLLDALSTTYGYNPRFNDDNHATTSGDGA